MAQPSMYRGRARSGPQQQSKPCYGALDPHGGLMPYGKLLQIMPIHIHMRVSVCIIAPLCRSLSFCPHVWPYIYV